MPVSSANKPASPADCLHMTANLSTLAVKLLEAGKVSQKQYEQLTATANLMVDIYTHWTKESESK